MKIIQSSLSYDDVLSILIAGDGDFSPSLTSALDIEQYALKLSKFAKFVLLQDDSDYKGCIAYYENKEGNFIYITHYWVSRELQGQDYGKRLFHEMLEIVDSCFSEIRLEVVKGNPAFLFYLKQGFRSVEDRGEKELLSLAR